MYFGFTYSGCHVNIYVFLLLGVSYKFSQTQCHVTSNKRPVAYLIFESLGWVIIRGGAYLKGLS